MRISYKPLWRILLEKEISKKQLREMSGISTASLAKLGKGENLTTDVLLKICEALNCNQNQLAKSYFSQPRNPDIPVQSFHHERSS